MNKTNVKPAQGKLGIMVVGCGAVSTTFMTGVLMARKGLAKPVGSMTQYDKMRVGRGADAKYLHYSDIVPLAKLDDIVFGCWDVYPQNAYQAAMYAEVLKEKDIEPVREELEQIVPLKAAFDKNYAKRLDGDNVKQGLSRWQMVEALREDIRQFKVSDWTSIRQHTLSLLFQELRLFPELSALENVQIKNGLTNHKSYKEIEAWFERLGIADKMSAKVGRMSFGQQQRVAMIRALVQPFDFLMVDEPISHLDDVNSAIMCDIMMEEARRQGAGVIVTSIGKHMNMSYDKTFCL